MPIAVFGSKVFDSSSSKLYIFDNFQSGTSLSTEKQDAAGKKPSTYNKGPSLSNFGLVIRLDVAQGVNPRKEIEEWGAIVEAGIAYPFILGKRPFGKNKWLAIEAQATDQIIDNQGNILFANLNLKFDEYVRPGSASASNTGSSPGVDDIDYSTFIPVDKSTYTRDNPEMSRTAWQDLKGETNTAVISRITFDKFKEA